MSDHRAASWVSPSLSWISWKEDPFGLRAERGTLPLGLALSPVSRNPRVGVLPEGIEPGEAWVDLGEQVWSEVCARPRVALDNLGLEPMKPAPSEVSPPQLSKLPRLHELQAELARQHLGTGGTLLLPEVLRRHPAAASLVDSWGRQGWSFASLDTVLTEVLGNRRRLVWGSPHYLFVFSEGQVQVIPNGPQAAFALAIGRTVRVRLAGMLPNYLGRWLQARESVLGWYLEQRVRYGILRALDHNQAIAEVVLGGAEHPLFAVPDGDMGPGLEELCRQRFLVSLPPRDTTGEYWRRVCQPGFLQHPDGSPATPMRWDGVATELGDDGHCGKLSFFLGFNGHEHRKARVLPRDLQPVEGEAATEWQDSLELDTEEVELPEPEAVVPEAPVVPPAPAVRLPEQEVPPGFDVGPPPWMDAAPPPAPVVPEPAPAPPAPPVDELAARKPQGFVLPRPHRRESVTLYIDGEVVAAANLRASRKAGSEARPVYAIDRLVVRSGALTRIEYRRDDRAGGENS